MSSSRIRPAISATPSAYILPCGTDDPAAGGHPVWRMPRGLPRSVPGVAPGPVLAVCGPFVLLQWAASLVAWLLCGLGLNWLSVERPAGI
ncbi:hypothetical protein [Micromonospora sp. NPDC006431]|uniref:hypothetical protein n=1 Tax=Micromonospora sp. NPDC006431 TaxID=3364235 RepID=UPI0036A7BA8A